MSSFPHKQFQGKLYEFSHLTPTSHTVPLNAAGTASTHLHVSYSIHCFTEGFDPFRHQDHHRYTHANETRAFDIVRYECSLQLPSIVANMARAKVYRALQNNYTYVARIEHAALQQAYSLFFTLKNGTEGGAPLVQMYVQSAYIKPLTIGPNAKNWRFGSLLGQLTGVFTPPPKKERPKKKAP